MLRKLVALLILLPLAVVIVAFAVANRQTVTVSFDPFSATDPAFVLNLPLWGLMFLLLLFGILIGGVAAWLKQHKWRRRARRLEARLERTETELAAAKGHSDTAELPMIRRAPPIALRPPAA